MPSVLKVFNLLLVVSLASDFVCSSETPYHCHSADLLLCIPFQGMPSLSDTPTLPLMDILKTVLLGLPSPSRQLSWVESFWEVSFSAASARIRLHSSDFTSLCHYRQLFQQLFPLRHLQVRIRPLSLFNSRDRRRWVLRILTTLLRYSFSMAV